MFVDAHRDTLRLRMANLKPDAAARWGRFTAPQMVAHVNDALRMALGDLPTRRKNVAIPIRYFPLKHLFIYVLPMPRGAPTSRELLARVDGAQFERECETFPKLLERVGARSGVTDWPEHPAFGKMSRRDWGVLGYSHVHHHLSQFGV